MEKNSSFRGLGATILIIAAWSIPSLGQKSDCINIKEAPPRTICYASYENYNTYVPPPESYLKQKNVQAKTKTASFEVQYVNFSIEAQEAFQEAVEIWESIIQSDITIRITAYWQPLSTGVLGSASPGAYVTNSDGVQRRNVWYPIALAEKIAGHDLNSTSSPDIVASFNSTYESWHFGIGTPPPAGKFDFVSIVLHEIGHGLGITHGYSLQGSQGLISSFFSGQPVVYESFLETNGGLNLLANFSAPSTDLGTQLTSANLFFKGPNVLTGNNNQRGKVYAPSTYSSGSSIAHLDELTYPAGDANSLMTPQIGFGERIHDPGPIALGILKDIGWIGTVIHHTPLLNSEDLNTPFEVVCSIKSDIAYKSETVTLTYRAGNETFTSISMVPTGTDDEFSASIPATGSIGSYEYAISVENTSNLVSTNPGKKYTQGSQVQPHYFSFEAGPDVDAPTIIHEPKPFLLEGDTELEVTAIVRDNISILSAVVEYLINDIPQGSAAMSLTSAEDSLYQVVISYPAPLSLNDKVKYRIIATDNSAAQNVSHFPVTGYIELNAEGLAPTQDFYVNDFNSNSDDFFGNGFSITTPQGFVDGAIHSDHPYTEGNGLPNDELNLIYQLRIPIRVKSKEATIKFDEVVLVEPGESSVFGNESFFDFVVVEGSSDGGVTWKTVANGYDSRDFTPWLNKYNSSITGNISNAVGDPTLFRTRTLSLLNKFSPGDEVVIRFRLYSDPFAVGWGWAIDNLKIQIDDTPPKIAHDLVEYIVKNDEPVSLSVRASDASELQSIAIDYFVNDGDEITSEFLLSEFTDIYTLNLDVTEMLPGDQLNYRIRASDVDGNESSLPSNGFFAVPYIDLENTVSQYFSDFNTTHNDFAGNFFSIGMPTNFSSQIFQTIHDYPIGFGMDTTSNFVALLKTPIMVNAENPHVVFDEISLIAPNDFMIMEASKDDGETWIALTEQYNSESKSAWTGAWINKRAGDSTLLRKRFFSLIESGDFVANDKILIRFRLFTDKVTTGWGWAMDNLSIQGPVTGLEQLTTEPRMKVFPNPVTKNMLNVTVNNPSQQPISLQFLNANGAVVQQEQSPDNAKQLDKQIDVSTWQSGFYMLRGQIGNQTTSVKFIIIH